MRSTFLLSLVIFLFVGTSLKVQAQEKDTCVVFVDPKVINYWYDYNSWHLLIDLGDTCKNYHGATIIYRFNTCGMYHPIATFYGNQLLLIINPVLLVGCYMFDGEICLVSNKNKYCGNITFDLNKILTCPPPTNDRLTRVSATRAVVTWDAVPNASQYVVYVRPVGGKTTSYPGASNTRTLVGLKPEKEYEYRIRTLCPDKKTSAFTEWKRFITPKPDPK